MEGKHQAWTATGNRGDRANIGGVRRLVSRFLDQEPSRKGYLSAQLRISEALQGRQRGPVRKRDSHRGPGCAGSNARSARMGGHMETLICGKQRLDYSRCPCFNLGKRYLPIRTAFAA